MEFKKENIDPDLLDIIPSYIDSLKLNLKNLKEFLSQKDDIKMRAICHKILGTAISYGFLQLDEIVKKLQENLIKLDWVAVEKDLDILKEYLNFIQRENLQ